MNSSSNKRTTRALLTLTLGSLAAAPSWAGGGTTGVTERISFTEDGSSVSENCADPAISADGRFVAFSTEEALLAADDNGRSDIYVQDRETGLLVCASVNYWGQYVDGDAMYPSISANGRCVAFETTADAFGFDVNGTTDVIFVDLDEGVPRMASGTNGSIVSGNNTSRAPSLSADGRYVAFQTAASDILPGDTNTKWDIYVHDMLTGNVSRASIGTLGESNDNSFNPSISANGLRVAFESLASNLIFGDANGERDIFVHRFDGGFTQLMTRSAVGDQSDNSSHHAEISDDGIIVLYRSEASNLVANDLNGQSDAFYGIVGQQGAFLVSASLAGTPANGSTTHVNLSPDGRYAAFRNSGNNLTPSSSGIADVYLRDLETLSTWLVSRPTGATLVANHGSSAPAVSENGAHVAFLSNATNLDLSDTNSVTDIYVRTTIEDATPYCDTMITVAGCEPSITSIGISSASADAGFNIVATDVAPDKPSLLFYGFSGRKSLPFMGGTHCVKGSTKRSLILRSVPVGAGPCDGVLTFDMNAFAAGAIPGNPQLALSVVGQTVNAQFWGRDPGSAFGVFLTNAIEYVVGP